MAEEKVCTRCYSSGPTQRRKLTSSAAEIGMGIVGWFLIGASVLLTVYLLSEVTGPAAGMGFLVSVGIFAMPVALGILLLSLAGIHKAIQDSGTGQVCSTCGSPEVVPPESPRARAIGEAKKPSE